MSKQGREKTTGNEGTLTPSFPVEKQRDKLRLHKARESVKEHIKGLLEGVLPQEALTNSMTTTPGPLRFLWRPNNYRLKIPFSKDFKLPNSKQEIKRVLCRFPMEISKHTGKVTLKKFRPGLTVEINPSCVVAIYSFRKDNKKAWYDVRASCLKDFYSFIDDKVKESEDYCLSGVKKLDLSLDYNNRSWIRHEDEVKGEEFIDSIPEDLIEHDTYFKKVYRKGLEFKGPVYLKNYITNRVLEEGVGVIAEELAFIKDKLTRPDLLLFLKENIKSSEDVVNKFWPEVLKLNQDEKEELTEWLFNSYHNEVII